jgi:hypothetical protein
MRGRNERKILKIIGGRERKEERKGIRKGEVSGCMCVYEGRKGGGG